MRRRVGPQQIEEGGLRAEVEKTEARKHGRPMSVLARHLLDGYSRPHERRHPDPLGHRAGRPARRRATPAAVSRALGLRRHRTGFFVLFSASWSSFSKAVSIAFSPGLPSHL